MNILISTNKRYVNQVNVLLRSIQNSNQEENFDVYVFHKCLTSNDITTIRNGLNVEKLKIIDIKMSDEELSNFPIYEKRYSVEIYFRLLATKYLPKELDRILYLDADIVIINKLNELYEMDFEGNYYIATTHIGKVLHKFNEKRLGIKKDIPYINSGMLLINLEEMRKIDVEKDIVNFVMQNKEKLMLPDQDVITALYGDKIKLVDAIKYNLGEKGLKEYNIRNIKNPIDLKWISENTVVIHYYGRNKPWNKKYLGKLDCFYNKIEKV